MFALHLFLQILRQFVERLIFGCLGGPLAKLLLEFRELFGRLFRILSVRDGAFERLRQAFEFAGGFLLFGHRLDGVIFTERIRRFVERLLVECVGVGDLCGAFGFLCEFIGLVGDFLLLLRGLFQRFPFRVGIEFVVRAIQIFLLVRELFRFLRESIRLFVLEAIERLLERVVTLYHVLQVRIQVLLFLRGFVRGLQVVGVLFEFLGEFLLLVRDLFELLFVEPILREFVVLRDQCIQLLDGFIELRGGLDNVHVARLRCGFVLRLPQHVVGTLQRRIGDVANLLRQPAQFGRQPHHAGEFFELPRHVLGFVPGIFELRELVGGQVRLADRFLLDTLNIVVRIDGVLERGLQLFLDLVAFIEHVLLGERFRGRIDANDGPAFFGIHNALRADARFRYRTIIERPNAILDRVAFLALIHQVEAVTPLGTRRPQVFQHDR